MARLGRLKMLTIDHLEHIFINQHIKPCSRDHNSFVSIISDLTFQRQSNGVSKNSMKSALKKNVILV